MLIKAKLRFLIKIKIKSKIEGSIEKPRIYLRLQSAMVQKNKSGLSFQQRKTKKAICFHLKPASF
jgi:hypothetical protein